MVEPYLRRAGEVGYAMSLISRTFKLADYARAQSRLAHPIERALELACRALPDAAGELKAELYRRAGYDIGSGVNLADGLRLRGSGDHRANLHIGARCYINAGCTFELAAPIFIEEDCAVGPEVLFLTTTHQRLESPPICGPRVLAPIHVRRGSWIGARAILLGGTVLHPGAFVRANTVVWAEHCQ